MGVGAAEFKGGVFRLHLRRARYRPPSDFLTDLTWPLRCLPRPYETA